MFTWLLEMVLPITCLSCSKPVASPGLCDSCWINSGLIASPYCAACGRPQPFELADEVCTSCSVQPPHLDKIRAVCRYTDISRQLIIGLKHAGKIHRVPLLSQMMAHAASDMIMHESTSPMMVIPVRCTGVVICIGVLISLLNWPETYADTIPGSWNFCLICCCALSIHPRWQENQKPSALKPLQLHSACIHHPLKAGSNALCYW